MRVTTSKSKNSESFYISKGFVNDKGVSTSVIVRKLGTLNDLLKEHGPSRDDVMAWAREEARLETLKYKQERESKAVQITFHADRQLDYDRQNFFRGGYLRTTGATILIDESGEWTSSEFRFPSDGYYGYGSLEAPSAYDLFAFTVDQKLTHRGHWGIYWMGAAVAALNIVDLLYAEEFFLWHMSWHVNEPEKIEPSDWELFRRNLGWGIVLVLSLVFFLMGLFTVV